jgi:ComEC/Rec2-related protein
VTLKIVSLATAFIVGIALATWFRVPVAEWALLGASGVGACLTVWLHLRERHWKEHARVVVALAAVGCGLPLGYWRTMLQFAPPAPGSLVSALQQIPAWTPFTLQGTISAEPDYKDQGRGELMVRARKLRTGEDGPWAEVAPANVLVALAVPVRAGGEARERFDRLMHPAAYGYTVEVSAKQVPERRPMNPGEFDVDAFLAQSDVVARFRTSPTRVTILRETRGNLLLEMALAAKERFLVTIKDTVRSPASRLAAGATLGVRRAVERQPFHGLDITEMFRHTGVGHILAVSGLHVSIISVLLYSLFTLSGLRPRVFAPPMLLFLVLFALLTGARPSSVRAVVMNGTVIVAYTYFNVSLRQATGMGLALSSLFLLLGSPPLLYAPSFVLSFGAVLSLVIITPVIDPWLRRPRGFSLLFAVGWFAGLLAFASLSLDAAIRPCNLLGMGGLLWLLLAAGERLNERFPRMLELGMERVPAGLRLFVGAQFAIQFGMMVPLSAWFFGRFPIAGILVNLLAIPAIGILVQLCMLGGLIGLVPVVGPYIAMPLGAAVTVMGEFFYWMTYVGTKAFPFPVTVRPSAGWMAGYYAVLAAVLVVLSSRRRMLGFACRVWPWWKKHPVALGCLRVAPFLLAALPALDLLRPPESVERVACLAARRCPLVAAVSSRGRALTVNAGDTFTGGSMLFDALRTLGATRVDTAVVAGADPALGNEGIVSLRVKMPVQRCRMAAVADTAEAYLRVVGDDYLISMAAEGESWARRYGTAGAEAVAALRASGTDVGSLAPGPVCGWSDASLEALPRLPRPPSRFASSAATAVLGLQTRGFRWLVLSDSTPAALREALRNSAEPWDVLVAGDLSSRKDFRELIGLAADRARPRVVVLCGDARPAAFDAEAWAAGRRAFVLLQTAVDGAVTAEFTPGGGMTLATLVTRRTVNLAQPAAPSIARHGSGL